MEKLIDTTEKVIVDNFQANFIYGYDKETGLAQFTNNEDLYGFLNLSGDIGHCCKVLVGTSF